ncbi:sigma-54 dependent transcriptional regulator [Coraliomargarita algicola]|uniref:DNA-binding transcriptional regulator NtrC n=1 Tax=Coraliomargarita algicola TaxID=3092156 RepID=A0ABZ0RTF1_9BACT|nr:sigma-54 dependent transcriptional regulator [Coraliomargarita sp. J2-16]WPJ98137.1 sigma-54 dependent transcriptional regulator [Coraliomargarita sp. J2-16]
MSHAPITPKVLVIDDDNDLRYSLKRVLSGRQYEVLEAASGEEGLSMAEQHNPHVILLDNRMGGMSGMEALQHLRGINPNAMIILMTAYGTTQTTIEAMKFGAFDYIMKPFDLKKILTLTESAIAASKDLDKAGKEEAAPAVSNEDIEGGIIGSSSAMQEVFKMIGQVAASDVTVMVTGESGTGKELIARAIYQNSLRAQKPYIAVNCAAIPENLIESELFGHEKGSFTGATNQRIGKFELCDGGTIFLDEIGDMALTTQTKILRALQEGEIQRVGSSETIKVNVRMLAATNKPLEEMVKDKTFREDLYYRLNVVRIQLPPLRERKEDVPKLIDFVLKRLARDSKADTKSISPEALALLNQYRWPGNVRELENLIYRSAVLAQGDMILIKDLPQEVVKAIHAASPSAAPEPSTTEVEPVAEDAVVEVAPQETMETAAVAERVPAPDPTTLLGQPLPDPYDAVYQALRDSHDTNILEHAERALIARALGESGGKQVRAAEILGMTRATLRKRIDQYDLG